MSNLPANLGAVSSKFASANIANTAAAGIEGGFASLKYKGSKWAIDYRGQSTPITRTVDGETFQSMTVEVVIIDASPTKSKVFYSAGYAGEGSNEKPTCSSANGVTPDAHVVNKQANVCATCPMNQSGSRIDENGQARGKACRDVKRTAVVPIGDLENERFGGPMLLRVPAASLVDFAKYTQELERMGAPFCSVSTRITFGPEAYPKFVFSPVRALSDEEAETILRLRDDPQTKRIIAGGMSEAAPASNPALADLGPISSKMAGIAPAQADKPLSQQAAAKAPPKAVPKVAPKAASAPVEEDATFVSDEAIASGTSLDDELDALLG